MKKEEKAVLDLLLKIFQKYIAFLSAIALYTSFRLVYMLFNEEKDLRNSVGTVACPCPLRLLVPPPGQGQAAIPTVGSVSAEVA